MDQIDERVLELIETLLENRGNFFSRETLRSFDWSMRSQIANRYMLNELMIAELINRVYLNNIQARSAAATLITLATNPLGNTTTFFDPVPITPTNAQINSALWDSPNITGTCSICQDAISSGGTRIRHCGHVYHRDCIVNWFGMSVRCPVCRHDIRQVGPANQTSVAASGTPSQQQGQ